jgi:hypothetical protein
MVDNMFISCSRVVYKLLTNSPLLHTKLVYLANSFVGAVQKSLVISKKLTFFTPTPSTAPGSLSISKNDSIHSIHRPYYYNYYSLYIIN